MSFTSNQGHHERQSSQGWILLKRKRQQQWQWRYYGEVATTHSDTKCPILFGNLKMVKLRKLQLTCFQESDVKTHFWMRSGILNHCALWRPCLSKICCGGPLNSMETGNTKSGITLTCTGKHHVAMLVNNNRNKATENPPPVITLPTGMKQNICSIHSLSYCL